MEEGDVMNDLDDLEAIALAVKECRPQAPSTEPPTPSTKPPNRGLLEEALLLIVTIMLGFFELFGLTPRCPTSKP